MKRYMKWVPMAVAFVVIAALSWSASEKVDVKGSKFPIAFQSGIYVGPANVQDPTADKRNRIGSIYSDFQSWDFPALVGGPAALVISCSETGAFTKRGLRFGDTCTVGVDQALNDWVSVRPVITAANTYKLIACATGLSDAGAPNQGDSGYTTTCLGNLAR